MSGRITILQIIAGEDIRGGLKDTRIDHSRVGDLKKKQANTYIKGDLSK